jgi:hypothetical protein
MLIDLDGHRRACHRWILALIPEAANSLGLRTAFANLRGPDVEAIATQR